MILMILDLKCQIIQSLLNMIIILMDLIAMKQWVKNCLFYITKKINKNKFKKNKNKKKMKKVNKINFNQKEN